ncbi:MAG: metallophosphoesterase [Aeromicrobium sp.]|uniref:metallophosphoesterase n=1 Tax=Aeromicrobium sp. TaxID=1871063 RepID=UPI0039E33E54
MDCSVIQADAVGLAGDWHGSARHAVAAIGRFARLGAEGGPEVRWIFHLGDFGLWPNAMGVRYLNRVAEALARADLFMAVTPGNHEDWNELEKAFAQGGYREPVEGRPRLVFLPPGYRFDLVTSSGVTRRVLSVGGAPSVDSGQRVEGKTWWRGEAVTDADVDRAVNGGRADVLLAHDAPDDSTSAVRQIVEGPSPWPAEALERARRGREQLNRVCAAVRPSVYAHGHYHVHDVEQRGETLFASLDCQGRPGNLMLLDVEELSVASL